MWRKKNPYKFTLGFDKTKPDTCMCGRDFKFRKG